MSYSSSPSQSIIPKQQVYDERERESEREREDQNSGMSKTWPRERKRESVCVLKVLLFFDSIDNIWGVK